jgi:hypothetical protein
LRLHAEAYTRKIQKYTTEPFFSSPLVGYLPASKTVPNPEVDLTRRAVPPLPKVLARHRPQGCRQITAIIISIALPAI